MKKKNTGGTYRKDQFYLRLIRILPFKDIVGFSEFVDSHQKASAMENYSVKYKIKIVDSAEGEGIHIYDSEQSRFLSAAPLELLKSVNSPIPR